VLVGAEGAGLLEQAVHERRLAVVHVRDDGDVPDVLHNLKPSWIVCLLNEKGQAACERKLDTNFTNSHKLKACKAERK